MKILINSVIIIVLIVVWGVFYKRNIKDKDISTGNKILIIVFIIAFNLLSLYIFNLSNKKVYFAEFNKIEISLQLGNIESFLTDNKDKYKESMKKDTVKIASELLLKHKFNFNPKSRNKVSIVFSDSISYDNKKRVYLIKLLLKYPFKKQIKEIETYMIIRDDRISYKKIISVYENTLNELFNSIFYNISLNSKKPEEIVEILRHKFNLPDIYYVNLFNHLLLLDNPPPLPDKVLLRYLNKPATFSEATGYAITTNNCNVIDKIIDKSLYFQPSPLETLLSILIQSKCSSVKGYLTVLKSSQSKTISDMAEKYLKQYNENNKKEFIYKNGKRTEAK